MILKDESNPFAPQAGEGGIVKDAGLMLFDKQDPAGRAVEQANDIEQRALAGARRANQRARWKLVASAKAFRPEHGARHTSRRPTLSASLHGPTLMCIEARFRLLARL